MGTRFVLQRIRQDVFAEHAQSTFQPLHTQTSTCIARVWKVGHYLIRRVKVIELRIEIKTNGPPTTAPGYKLILLADVLSLRAVTVNFQIS